MKRVLLTALAILGTSGVAIAQHTSGTEISIALDGSEAKALYQILEKHDQPSDNSIIEFGTVEAESVQCWSGTDEEQDCWLAFENVLVKLDVNEAEEILEILGATGPFEDPAGLKTGAIKCSYSTPLVASPDGSFISHTEVFECTIKPTHAREV